MLGSEHYHKRITIIGAEMAPLVHWKDSNSDLRNPPNLRNPHQFLFSILETHRALAK